MSLRPSCSRSGCAWPSVAGLGERLLADTSSTARAARLRKPIAKFEPQFKLDECATEGEVGRAFLARWSRSRGRQVPGKEARWPAVRQMADG